MRVQEKEAIHEELEKTADILEEDDHQDQQHQQEEGEGGCCCRWGARQRGGPCGGTVGLVDQLVVHSRRTMFDYADSINK